MQTLSFWGISEIRLEHRGASITSTSNDRKFDGSLIHGMGDIVRGGSLQKNAFADVTLGATKVGFDARVQTNGVNFFTEGSDNVTTLDMNGKGSANVNLASFNYDAVLGDARSNTMDATGRKTAATMRGEGGDDTLLGSNFSDILHGGVGRNKLYGARATT